MIASQTIAARMFRALNPSSRVTGCFRYGRNTASRKQRECILCDDKCPGWSARYARTKASIEWERDHDCSMAYLAKHMSADQIARAIAIAQQDTVDASVVLDDLIRELVPSRKSAS